MADKTYNLNRFNPEFGVNPQTRSVGSIYETGAVTYDAYFGENVLSRFIYVGTSGNLSYVKENGATETLPNLVAGVWHPIAAQKINSSGTSIAADQLRWGN